MARGKGMLNLTLMNLNAGHYLVEVSKRQWQLVAGNIRRG